ncbi:MAG: carboxypeptidase M32 [Peptostreptococcaceae bacterium]|nr:carboxypeptidase M32 [Peptostreptococcaceae bacterium]
MLTENIEKLNKLDSKLSAVFYTQSLLEWDAETIASIGGVEERAIVAGKISEIYFNTFINTDVENLLEELNERKAELDEITKAKVSIYKRKFDNIAKIPVKDYSDYQVLISKSYSAWEKAKNEEDFSIFAPFLEKIIIYQKKFIKLRGKSGHPYNTILDDFEPGITVEILDEFFDKLRDSIVPLVQKVCDKQSKDIDFINQKFDIAKQAEFSEYIIPKLGFDNSRGMMTTSVHPFTLNLSRNDVRITTHFQENNITESIFTTIHETGHAMYEQNISEKYGLSALTTGVSMGIHESQSRLYENNLGRNINFWNFNLPILKHLYEKELKDVSIGKWYAAVNHVKRSLIRIEADEVTYPLHIMVRYEIEKKIFSEDIDVNELPSIWNDLYEEYLGIRPKNDAEGILQDVHWSGGDFGYFPSYALGSAYAAQFEKTMRKKMDIDKDLNNLEMDEIKEWLKENIHKYGSSKMPSEIIKDATGEKFNSDYYIEYLYNKYDN